MKRLSRSLLSTLILLLISGIWAAVNWRAGGIFGPTDSVAQFLPSAKPAETTPWEVLRADGVLQFQPWRKLVFESWANGQLPAWNPYQLCGTPLLANSQSGALYPPHVILGLLHVPWDWGMRLLFVFHSVVLTTGFWLLARSFGASRRGASMAAIGLVFSALFLSWAPIASVGSTLAWFPWMLFGIRRTAQGEPSYLLIAGAVGLSVLGGHLQFAAYALMGTVLVALIHAPKLRIKTLVVFAAIGGGLLLAAPQLVPVLSFSKLSHRQGTATDAGYEAYAKSALLARELPALFVPQALGQPDIAIKMDVLKGEVAASWVNYLKPGGNYAESAFGWGALLLVGAFLVRFRRAPQLVLVGASITGLGLLLVAPTPLQKLLYFSLPGWSATGSPGRAGVLVLFGGALLAAGARPGRAQFFVKKPVLGLLAFALVIGGFVLVTPMVAAPLDGIGVLALRAVVMSLLIGVLLWGLMLVRGLSVRLEGLLSATILVAGALALMSPTLSSQGGRAATPRRVAYLNDSWSLYTQPPALSPGNLASMRGEFDVAGYDSLLAAETVRMLDIANQGPSAPPENGNMMFVRSSSTPEELVRLGVSTVFSRKESWAGRRGTSTDSGLYQFDLDGSDLLSGGKIITYRPGFVEFLVTGEPVLRERNLPGWKAEVDGKPVGIPPGPWLEVGTPPLGSKVVLRYQPPGLSLGWGLLLIGLLDLFAIEFLNRRTKEL